MSKTVVETAQPQIMYFDPSVLSRSQVVVKGLVLGMPDDAFALPSEGVISVLNILFILKKKYFLSVVLFAYFPCNYVKCFAILKRDTCEMLHLL